MITGRYEWPPSAYKHFYFNSTHSMLAVWLVVVIGIILLYECVRAIIPLIYYSRCLLRHEMLALFVSSLYPHYYGWWGLINYINEDFYSQWKHQVPYVIFDLLPLMTDDSCCLWALKFLYSVNFFTIQKHHSLMLITVFLAFGETLIYTVSLLIVYRAMCLFL